MSRKATPDREVRAAHRRLSARLGRAPTCTELGEAMGITHQSATNRMQALGLPRSTMRMKMIPDGDILEAHEQLCAQLGRAPTSTELGRRIGLSEPSTANRMRTLGLARTRMSRSEAGRLGADESNRVKRERGLRQPVHREDDPMEAKMRAERDRRRRYWAVARSGGEDGQAPKRLPMPGEGLAPWARQSICCAICGRKVTITPRTHPWYMRDAGGAVRFLCSEQCMRGVDL